MREGPSEVPRASRPGSWFLAVCDPEHRRCPGFSPRLISKPCFISVRRSGSARSTAWAFGTNHPFVAARIAQGPRSGLERASLCRKRGPCRATHRPARAAFGRPWQLQLGARRGRRNALQGVRRRTCVDDASALRPERLRHDECPHSNLQTARGRDRGFERDRVRARPSEGPAASSRRCSRISMSSASTTTSLSEASSGRCR